MAQAIVLNLAGRGLPQSSPIDEVKAFSGKGVMGRFENRKIFVGSLAWMRERGVRGLPDVQDNPCCVVSDESKALLLFEWNDEIRPESLPVIRQLSDWGLSSSILSGDSPRVVTSVANQLGLSGSNALGGLTPEQKLKAIKPSSIMIGDGVNDSAALAAADVGIGFTGGAQQTLQSAAVYLAKPNLDLVLGLFLIARQTQCVLKRNFAIALTYNLVGSLLAIAGFINPVWAALVMPVNSLTVVASTLGSQAFRKTRAWS